VLERAEADLLPMLISGSTEMRLPGSTKLLAARSIASYLETADTLFASYGLVSPSICAEVLSVRGNWQSAFLTNLDLQAAAPALSQTSGWPYFTMVGPLALTLSDCYLAAIVTFLELLVPAPFLRLKETGTCKGGPVKPLEFIHALLAD
jgi:hypothetical protein